MDPTAIRLMHRQRNPLHRRVIEPAGPQAICDTKPVPGGFRRQFGSTEGGRTDLEDPLRDFVSFPHAFFRSGIGMDANDRTARVLVGRKGSGKTLYLRRLQSAARGENALYADDWRTDLPPTSEIVRVFDWASDRQDAVERWERIWKRAIQRATVSHLQYHPELARSVGNHLLSLRAYEDVLFAPFDAPVSIYSQVSAIVNEHWDLQTRHRNPGVLDRYLGRPEWAGFQHHLYEALRVVKPLCFYLDGADERFTAAPKQWLACQEGLFNEVMALLAGDQHVGSRLHVVVGIVDLVFSSVQQSWQSTKLAGSQYIRALHWGIRAIRHFLHERITTLDPSYLLNDNATDPVERWLGIRTIVNTARGETELLEDYLLRHTRLIPRDVVQLGNKLCDVIDRVRYDMDNPVLLEEDIRSVVRVEAMRFANEELLGVANHITASIAPIGAAEMGIDPLYTGEAKKSKRKDRPAQNFTAMQETLRVTLKDILSTSLACDRFDRTALMTLEREARDRLGDIDLPSILWQHGLLGYIEESVEAGQPTFFGSELTLSIPTRKAGYALHPALLAAVDGLRSYGTAVLPYTKPPDPRASQVFP